MKIEATENGIAVYEISGLSLPETLDCGQCFRWKKNSAGNWCGVVKGIYKEIRQEENGITILNTSEDEFNSVWYDYFDFGTDYDKLKDEFSVNETLRDACKFAPGIRVLHQEPWEAFITFMISQNNNIARIKGIVERLCNTFGDRIKDEIYSFPTPERLANVDVEELKQIGCGYRAEYISAAAKDVAAGNIDLEKLKSLPVDESRPKLLSIYGVGPKVADCILLYGFGKFERCPADVWMKRVIVALGGEMPECVTSYAGIAQQFLFHYARNYPEKFVIPKE